MPFLYIHLFISLTKIEKIFHNFPMGNDEFTIDKNE